MRLKKRVPLNFNSMADSVEPDTDLDFPDLAPPDMVAEPAYEPMTTVFSTGAPAPSANTSVSVAGTESAGVAAQAAPKAVAAPAFGHLSYWFALAGTVLWLALAAYAFGYELKPLGPLQYQPMALGAFIVLTLAPIGFIWILAYGVRQGARLAAEVTRARSLSEEMLLPAATAAAQAGSAVEQVRLEIDAATASAARARTELTALREVLAEESARLNEAAAESTRTAGALGQTLGRERIEMSQLASILDAQAAAIVDAIGRQAKMVAEASDLAQTQLGESEAALAARAADLAAAAGEAGDAARIASEDLSRQVDRLETAQGGVTDQVQSLEEVLTQQRAALVSVAHGLRADNEDFAVKLETQRAQVADMLAKARLGVSEVSDATVSGANSLRELASTVAEQCQALSETARTERDLLAASALKSLGAVSEAAKFERETLESDARHGIAALSEAAEAAHRAAESAGDAAKLRVEALSEAAFAAGQKAEAAFNARLDEANALIARSAEFVDQAAGESAARLEKAAQEARATLAEIQASVATFEARLAQLPAEGLARAEEIKAAVQQGLDDLLASSRRAAEETQAIDAAFQDRVRRNYEMLSEAVRLMGVVSTTSQSSISRADPAPRPAPRAPDPIRRPEPPVARATPSAAPEAAAQPPAPERSAADSAGLRPRLRFAPTSADRDIADVFHPAAPKAEPEAEKWTWQELLSTMDDAPLDEDQLADRLIGELDSIGVDLHAILPAPRIAEIATVVQSGDPIGARMVVRHLAPAAVRRLSRRAMSERVLRSHADRYIARYAAALDEAARRDPDGDSVTAILTSEAGRAYLLYDAAVGDLP